MRIFFAGISSVALLACCAGLISSSGPSTASMEALQATEAMAQQQAAFTEIHVGMPISRESAALRVACASCAESILSKHLPWQEGSMLDPEDALSCATEGACSAAAKQAAELALSHPSSERLEELAEIDGIWPKEQEKAQKKPNEANDVEKMSKEQFAYDSRVLDREQLALNWRRAKVFAEYAGAPRASGTTYVLATWVPPLDPLGRPVPSWLTFQPTALSQFLMSQAPSLQTALNQQFSQQAVGGLKPLETVTPLSNSQALVQHPPSCLVQTSCHACASIHGCEWCGGQEICAQECAALPQVIIYSKAEQCLARYGVSADLGNVQRANQQSIKSLVALSQMTSGTPLVAAATAQVSIHQTPL